MFKSNSCKKIVISHYRFFLTNLMRNETFYGSRIGRVYLENSASTYKLIIKRRASAINRSFSPDRIITRFITEFRFFAKKSLSRRKRRFLSIQLRLSHLRPEKAHRTFKLFSLSLIFVFISRRAPQCITARNRGLRMVASKGGG